MHRMDVVTNVKDSETSKTIRVNLQRQSLKGILLLFVELHTAGVRDPEKFVNHDLTNVNVMVNMVPNMLYNNCIDAKVTCSVIQHLAKTPHVERSLPNTRGLDSSGRSVNLIQVTRHTTSHTTLSKRILLPHQRELCMIAVSAH